MNTAKVALIVLVALIAGCGSTDHQVAQQQQEQEQAQTTQSPEDAPVDERWQVGDALVSVYISDIAEFEGEQVAEAYVDLYKCDDEAWTPEVQEAHEYIDNSGPLEGRGDEGPFDAAVEITDAYSAALEDCDREFARTTGEVPIRPWDPMSMESSSSIDFGSESATTYSP
jgi:uncharacterized protein YceK